MITQLVQKWRLIAPTVFSTLALQAALETGLLSVLYRDLLLAPYRFFTSALWDPAIRLYQVALVPLGFPDPLGSFLAQGAASKLALFPGLFAINWLWAAVLSCIFAIFLGAEKLGENARRVVVLTVLAQLLVLLAFWLPSVKIPADPTFTKVAHNYLRNALFDGFLIAVGLALVSGVLGAVLVARSRVVAGGAAAVAVCALGLGWSLGGSADAAAGTTSGDAKPLAPGYNVVLISIDSLRADHLGSYGYDRDTSPAIDTLAEQGVRFGRAASVTSWTLPSHMSLLTGRSMLGHGVVTDDRSLTTDVPTLAEQFSKLGYQTHAIVSAPYLNSRYGFARGFDQYDDKTIYFETNEDSYKSVTGPRLVDTAISFVEARASASPFFLFLHFWDAHYDYAPTPPYDTMFDPDYEGDVTGENFYFDRSINPDMNPRDLEHILALYDGEIRLIDDQIARLRTALAAKGLADNTVFVVTADHGDEFFEHGEKGHHRTLYEEVLWIPLVVNVPGTRRDRSVIDEQVSLIDIAPTLLSLVGGEPLEGVEGRDLSPLWTGKPSAARPAYAELYRKGSLNIQASASLGGRKVIHHFNRRILEAYDLASDPGETTTLASDTALASSMTSRLAAWLNREWKVFDRRVQRGDVDAVVLDSKTAEMLRSLGYAE